MMVDPADLLNARQTAERLGVARMTVTRLTRAGLLVPILTDPHVYHVQDVDRLAEERSKKK